MFFVIQFDGSEIPGDGFVGLVLVVESQPELKTKPVFFYVVFVALL